MGVESDLGPKRKFILDDLFYECVDLKNYGGQQVFVSIVQIELINSVSRLRNIFRFLA
jgi:hypothetical protein